MLTSKSVLSFVLLLSFPLMFLICQRLLPSKSEKIFLPDELDDIALFRRATLASLKPSNHDHHKTQYESILPFLNLNLKTNPPPKIAFLFLTNSDLHFAPLWEKFFQNKSSLCNIYIHADPYVKIKNPGGVFEGRFIVSKGTERGSASLISATRRLLATALLDDPLNMYFALISQHCVPIHSFNYIYNSLFHKPIIKSSPKSSKMTKFLYRSFIEILSGGPYMKERYVSRGRSVMLPEVPFRKFRVGSQFFIMTREHALLVIKDRRLWRKFRLPCMNKHSCYAEEHYFPTLLSMEDPKGCTHFTLTRVDWTNTTDGHPHIYHPKEVSPKVIQSLRASNTSSSYLFARKFSPDCLQPLLDIAETSLFRD